MKRLLTSAVLFLCCMATTFAQFSGSGSGTENDPYLILNPIQLNQLRNFLNQSGVYFKLMADIDLTEFIEDEYGSQGWKPVGTSSSPFKGILDGNGKSISGLIINRNEDDNIGLFAYVYGATIKDLTLNNANIIGKDNVGTLVGSCIGPTSTVVAGCTISGIVNGKTNVGGCVGKCNGVNGEGWSKISNIISTVNVIGDNNTGGISGTQLGDILNCKVNADITGSDYTGGICGYYKHGGHSPSNCIFIGNISGKSYVGGITGLKGGGEASTTKCFVAAHVFGTGDYIGGLTGYSDCNETINSYFSGTVEGGQEVGGIIGHIEGSGKITLCYTSSYVSGNKYVGGLCGKVNGRAGYYALFKRNVSYVYSVRATDGFVGRVYGGGVGLSSYSTDNKAYNRAIVINAGVTQDVVDDNLNGDGVSATTLRLKATYIALDWDFSDIWAIQETEGLPYFKWQTAPPVIQSQVVSGATTVSGKCVDGGTVTLEIDGVKQQMMSTGNTFSFTVSPLQAGHEVRVSAKADGKEQSYYTTEIVSYLGTGTEADPYQVYTAADLTGVYRKGYFKLMNDIDLTSYINQFSPTEGWESIGREGSETIHFDGNGHKITGLWCNSTRDNTGLFSCFANGTIKNLTVETANGKKVKGGNNTGILIGKMINGTIENCRVSGSVSDGTPVGGLVGLFTSGSILRCQADVTINTTLESSYVGALVGEMNDGVIDQCLTNGSLSVTGKESYGGGLAGKNSGSITNSYSNAKVTSSYNAAGVVAYNYGIVDKCYSTGDLFSNNYAAGVIGYNDGTYAVVSNCAAMNNKIEITYESQQVQQGGGYGQRIIGGIKNNAPVPEMNNYALKTMQVSVNDVPQKVYDDIMNGSAKTGIELMTMTTYQNLGWDFSDIWSIMEGESFPSLKNNVGIVGHDDTSGESEETSIALCGIDLQALPGTKVVLPIALTNEDEVKLCQFDLRLPAGVTVATKSNGKPDARLTARAESHTVTGKQLGNGDYRFVISSMDNDSFTGNEGTLVEIALDVSAKMEPGEYIVKMLNTEVSVPDGNDLKVVKPKDTESKMIVKTYTPGDVNNDGSVSVTDVGCAINYILEQVPSVFIFEAADMNGDKSVSVTDVGMIINVILSEGAASRMSMYTETDNGNSCPRLSLLPTAGGYELQLADNDDYMGFQFDVEIADGASINDIQLTDAKGNDHVMTYRRLDNGKWRVVCYSPTNSSFRPHQKGSLLNIATTGDITISNIRLTTSGLKEVRHAALAGSLTGIVSVEQGMQISMEGGVLRVISDHDTTLQLYTLGGSVSRVLEIHRGVNTFNGLRAGVYMLGNRKVILR